MIVKELDALESRDLLVRAGRKAEEQMAHYLWRAFQPHSSLHVFNGIRLEKAGDAAQIDHLVLHQYGIIIVESKSVTTRIRVNEHGEWTRWFGGSATGMPSPVLQARRQGQFLREYLQQHHEALLGKSLFGRLQHTFTCMPIDALVAISDCGIIDRPKQLPLPEVCKADQVPDRVTELIKEYRKANGLLSLDFSKGGYEFSKDEMAKIASFLREHHRPYTSRETSSGKPAAALRQTAPEVPGSAARPAQSEPTCRHCQSRTLLVQYGRYGYYLKCPSCEGNTPIRLTCRVCGRRERIHKSGNRFLAECDGCKSSRLYHTNPHGTCSGRTPCG